MTLRLGFLIAAVLLLILWPHFYLALALLLIASVQLLWDGHRQGLLSAWAKHPKKAAFPDAEGQWGGVLASVQKTFRHEQSLRTAVEEELFRVQNVLAAMPESLVLLDAEHKIIWANEVAERLLFIRLPQDIGAPIVWQERDEAFARWLKDPKAASLILKKQMGEEQKTLEHTRSRQAGHLGRITGASLLLSRDISDKVALDEMRRDFVANVSHELRTPLAVISANIETLQQLKLDADTEEKLMKGVADHSAHMSRVVDDLLTLSRLDAGHQDNEEEWCALLPVFLGLKASAESVSTLEIVLAVEADEQMLVSPHHLQMMLSNFLSNALRHTPAGGRITLGAVAHKDAFVLWVRDTGLGIASEHLPRLTERFYRVDKARSKAQGGTGLGLAIVKKTAALYEGELQIKSQLGLGSEFRLLFPTKYHRKHAI